MWKFTGLKLCTYWPTSPQQTPCRAASRLSPLAARPGLAIIAECQAIGVSIAAGGSFVSAVANAADLAAFRTRMTAGLAIVAEHQAIGASIAAGDSFVSAVANAADFAAFRTRTTAGLAIIAEHQTKGVSIAARDSFVSAVANAADFASFEAKANVGLVLVDALAGGGHGAVCCADAFWSVLSGIDPSALARDAIPKAAGAVKAAVQQALTGMPNLRLSFDNEFWAGVSDSLSVVEHVKRLVKLCGCLRDHASSKKLKLSTVTTLSASVLGQLGRAGTDDAVRQLAVSWWHFVRDSKRLSASRARVGMPEPKRTTFEGKLAAMRAALAAGNVRLTDDAKLTNSGGIFKTLATRSIAESTRVGEGLVSLNALLQAQGSAAKLFAVDDDAFHCVLPDGFDEPAVRTRMAARLGPLFDVPEHLRSSLDVNPAVLPEHWRVGAAEQTLHDGVLVGRDKVLATLVDCDTVFQRQRDGRVPTPRRSCGFFHASPEARHWPRSACPPPSSSIAPLC